MKRYWPLIGAVGIAATAGLYQYVNRDPLYEDPAEEFLEEETEYETEMPDHEIPRSYNHSGPAAKEKNEIKERQNSTKYNKKEEPPRNKQSNLPSFQKSPGLEETVEEEESPWYDLSQEARDFNDLEELKYYFDEALNAEDYKVAETYLDDIAERSQKPDLTKKKFFCKIFNKYYHYLLSVKKDVKEDCGSHDPYSVMRKIISMDSILNKYQDILYKHHENIIGCPSDESWYDPEDPPYLLTPEFGRINLIIPEITLTYVKERGKEVLLATINCPKEESHE